MRYPRFRGRTSHRKVDVEMSIHSDLMTPRLDALIARRAAARDSGEDPIGDVLPSRAAARIEARAAPIPLEPPRRELMQRPSAGRA